MNNIQLSGDSWQISDEFKFMCKGPSIMELLPAWPIESGPLTLLSDTSNAL